MGCCGSQSMHTVEIRASDVLPEEVQSNLITNSVISQEPIRFNVKLSDVHMRNLEVKEEWYLVFAFGDDIYTCQTRNITKKEEHPSFDIAWEFEQSFTLDNLKKHHLKISLMLARQDKSEAPLSVISIDFFTLAFGPTHHAIRFRRGGGRATLGLLQYNIHFEQVWNTQILLKKLKIKINSIEDKAVCTNFRWITPEAKLESSWSFSKVGTYQTKENETHVDFNFLTQKNSEPKLTFTTTMENLIDSSIQILLWRDTKGISNSEMIKTVITKNQSTGVKVDDVQVSVDESEPSDSSVSAFVSSYDSDEERESPSHSEEEAKGEEESKYSSVAEASHETESDNLRLSKQSSTRNLRYQLLGECHIGFTKILKEEMRYMDKKDSVIFGAATGSFNFGDLKDPNIMK